MATGRIGTTPVLRTRWSKEPAGGTTSLSGLDDYSVSLVYEVGYEAVYQNGALLSRGNDYTATDGTTITLTNATVAGDIIEVFANNVVPLTDTYSQSVADGKFVNNTIVDAKGDLIVGSAADTFTRLAVGSANQVLTVDSATTSGLKWAAPSTGAMTFISRTTFSNVASQAIDNIFSSTYESYLVVFNEIWANTDAGQDFQFQLRYSTSTQTSGYSGNSLEMGDTGGQTNATSPFSDTEFTVTGDTSASAASAAAGHMFIHKVGKSARPTWSGQFNNFNQPRYAIFGGQNQTQETYTGLLLKLSSTNISGTVTVYGLAKS